MTPSKHSRKHATVYFVQGGRVCDVSFLCRTWPGSLREIVGDRCGSSLFSFGTLGIADERIVD